MVINYLIGEYITDEFCLNFHCRTTPNNIIKKFFCFFLVISLKKSKLYGDGLRDILAVVDKIKRVISAEFLLNN